MRYASDPLKPTKNIVFFAWHGCCVIFRQELDCDLFVGKYIAGSKDITLNCISLYQRTGGKKLYHRNQNQVFPSGDIFYLSGQMTSMPREEEEIFCCLTFGGPE